MLFFFLKKNTKKNVIGEVFVKFITAFESGCGSFFILARTLARRWLRCVPLEVWPSGFHVTSSVGS